MPINVDGTENGGSDLGPVDLSVVDLVRSCAGETGDGKDEEGRGSAIAVEGQEGTGIGGDEPLGSTQRSISASADSHSPGDLNTSECEEQEDFEALAVAASASKNVFGTTKVGVVQNAINAGGLYACNMWNLR